MGFHVGQCEDIIVYIFRLVAILIRMGCTDKLLVLYECNYNFFHAYCNIDHFEVQENCRVDR
jgi:hypothetical protein